ncbi:MAG: helix-turn-helix domain-containing protein [Methanobacteriota archaeon]
MFEVQFRFRHGCEVNRLSDLYPEVPIGHWCNFRVEILEFNTKDPEVADAMRRDLARLYGRAPKSVKALSTAGRVTTVVTKCDHKQGRTISHLVERFGCLYLPPVVYQGGYEHYRIVAFDDRQLARLFAALAKRGEVHLERKGRLESELLGRMFMISASEVLSDLTEKQATALLAAVEGGYYRVPRMVRTEDIAKRRRVPRTTFEEHVRKAESKVINAMAPYLALYAAGQREAGAKDQVMRAGLPWQATPMGRRPAAVGPGRRPTIGAQVCLGVRAKMP